MNSPDNSQARERTFPIDAEARRRAVEVCDQIMQDPKASRRTKIQAVRALVAMDAIAIRDVHHRERMEYDSGVMHLKMQRAEDGKPNDSLAIVQPPVRKMAAPAWMEDEMRKVRGEG